MIFKDDLCALSYLKIQIQKRMNQNIGRNTKGAFLSRSVTFKLISQALIQLCLAYDQTWVVLRMAGIDSSLLDFYSADGKLTNQVFLQTGYYSFSMPNQNQIILQNYNGGVMFFSAKDSHARLFRENVKKSSMQKYIKSFFFPKSSLLCLLNVRNNSKDESLSIEFQYFHYKGIYQKCEAVSVFRHQSRGMASHYQRLDNCSKIAWLEHTRWGTCICILELNESYKEQITRIDIGKLNNRWQNALSKRSWRPLCHLNSDNYISVRIQSRKIQQKDEKESNYLRFQKCKIAQTGGVQFGADQRFYDSLYRSVNSEVDQLVIKKKDCVLVVTEHQSREGEQTKWCVLSKLDCLTEQLLTEETTSGSSEVTLRYENVEWSDKLILHTSKYPLEREMGNYQGEDGHYVDTMMHVRIIQLDTEVRSLYMLMLLHLNEDFDDDLLQDVVELLTESQPTY